MLNVVAFFLEPYGVKIHIIQYGTSFCKVYSPMSPSHRNQPQTGKWMHFQWTFLIPLDLTILLANHHYLSIIAVDMYQAH